LAVLVLLAPLLVQVRASGAATPAARVVLDPDDNLAWAIWPYPSGTTYTELPITSVIASQAKPMLEALCDTSVVITRGASPDVVDQSARAAQMAGADLSLTISLNSLGDPSNPAMPNQPWGNATDGSGGASSFATSAASNMAFAQRTLDAWTQFTGRSEQAGVNLGGTNGTIYPYAPFAALSGTYAQTFFGFLNHSFDWPAINAVYDNMPYGLLVDAVVTAVGQQLVAQGFTCGQASAGQTAFPTPPTAAQKAALWALGYTNWQRYGSDPVNFATGNFLQSVNLLTVPGPGGTSTSVDLTYNSMDPSSGRFGVGWSSGADPGSQTYTDGSVLVTDSDGSVVAFDSSGADSFTAAQPGVYERLARTSADTLVLTQPDGSTRTFTEDSYDGSGVLTKATDRAGHVWSYSHASQTITIPGAAPAWPVTSNGWSGGVSTPATHTKLGPLTAITAPGGKVIGFTNNAAGEVTRVTRPDGAVWRLAYDSGGHLTSITDPLGHATRYGYNGDGLMSTVTAPDGVTYITNTYDTRGRVVGQVNGDGDTATIAYGTGSTTYTDTTGAKTVFDMDSLGRVTKVTTPEGHTLGTGYADWDTTTSTDQNGNTTRYVYDANGNLTQVTDPMGATSKFAYTSRGDLTSANDALGGVTTFTVDSKGNTTAVAGPDGARWAQSFDSSGDLTARTDPNGHTTRYGYDGGGNLASVTDANGGVTALGYDGADRITSVTDPDGRATRYAYDTVGDLTSVTKPSGAKTSYAYQADGQVSSVTDPNGGVTSYTYNNGLNIATVTDASGGVTRYGYDSEYRRTSVTDPDGRVTRYAYDGEGLLTATTFPDGGVEERSYDAAQNLTAITSPGGNVTAIAYDADDRPTSVTDPAGAVTRFVYDALGRITWVTDPNGRQTSYAYDAAGNMVTVTDPSGGVSRYAYDPAGNLTGSTTPLGRTTSFAYDALDRVISQTTPTGGETTFAYDAASQLTSVTDPTGRAASYDYTLDGDLAAMTGPGGAVTRYAYDAAGRVSGVTDPRGGTVNFAYTPNGLLASRTDQNGHTTELAYDPAGQLVSSTDPAGVTTAYRYDPNGLLTAAIENATGGAAGRSADVATGYGYDEDGRLTSATSPNGQVTGYTVDGDGRVSAVTDPLGQVSRYSYDAAGNLVGSVDGNGHSITYTYDASDQLVGRTSATDALTGNSYAYDADGELTGTTDAIGRSSYAYDADGRLTSAVNDHGLRLSYAYDAAGRLTGLTYPDGKTATYSYDSAGRTASVTDASGTVGYGYDPAGNLTSIARPNGVDTAYAYDPVGNVTSIDHTAPAGVSASGASGVTGTGTSLNDAPGAGAAVPNAPAAPAAAPSVPSVPAGGPVAVLDAVVTAVAPGVAVPSSPVPALPGPVIPPWASGPNTSPAAGGGGGLVCVPGPGGGPVSAGCPLTSADVLPMRLDYTYDPDDRVASETQTSANVSLTSTYVYDALGRLTAASRSDGIDQSWTYDADGNPVRSTVIDPVSLVAVSTISAFNAAGQLTSQQSSDGTSSVDTYDHAGNRITQTTTAVGKQSRTAYSYNSQGQLVTASNPDTGSTRVNYDALGQISELTVPNPVDPATGAADCPNGSAQPGCASSSAGTANTPAPAGKQGKVRTVFGGDQAWLAYSGDTLVYIADTVATDIITIVNGPQGPDHQTTSTRAGSSTAWYQLDRLGSIRDLTDSSGATVAAAAYGPTGTAQPACAVPGIATVASVSPLGYTSEVADPGNGLQHYAARSYQPGTGQWLQPDPWGGDQTDPASLNKYNYVENNPTTYWDDSGYQLSDCYWGTVSGTGQCGNSGTVYPPASSGNKTSCPAGMHRAGRGAALTCKPDPVPQPPQKPMGCMGPGGERACTGGLPNGQEPYYYYANPQETSPNNFYYFGSNGYFYGLGPGSVAAWFGFGIAYAPSQEVWNRAYSAAFEEYRKALGWPAKDLTAVLACDSGFNYPVNMCSSTQQAFISNFFQYLGKQPGIIVNIGATAVDVENISNDWGTGLGVAGMKDAYTYGPSIGSLVLAAGAAGPGAQIILNKDGTVSFLNDDDKPRVPTGGTCQVPGKPKATVWACAWSVAATH